MHQPHFTSDGRWLALVMEGKEEEVQVERHVNVVIGALRSGGNVLGSGYPRQLRWWDLTKGGRFGGGEAPAQNAPPQPAGATVAWIGRADRHELTPTDRLVVLYAFGGVNHVMAHVWEPGASQPTRRFLIPTPSTQVPVEVSTYDMPLKLALSPQKAELLVVVNTHTNVWDLDSGTPRKPIPWPGEDRLHLEFSPDQRRALGEQKGGTPLAPRGTGNYRVYDWRSNVALSPLFSGGTIHFDSEGRCVRQTLTHEAGNTETRLWDWKTPDPLQALPSPWTENEKVVLTRDGKRAAGVLAGTVRFLEVHSGKALGPPLKVSGDVRVFFNGDGRFALTVSQEAKKDVCRLRVWEVETGQPVGPEWTMQGTKRAQADISRDGRRVAVILKQERRGPQVPGQLWDATTGNVVADWLKPVATAGLLHFDFAFSPDGRTLAVLESGRLDLRDAETGLVGKTWMLTERNKNPRMLDNSEPSLVVWSSDGRRLLASPLDYTQHVWICDPQAGSTQRLPGEERGGRLVGLAFSPDGRLIVTAQQQHFRLWDAGTGQPLMPLQQCRVAGQISGVPCFSADSRWLATRIWDSQVRLWDTRNGQPASPLVTLPGTLDVVEFAPGDRQYFADHRHRAARVWRVPGQSRSTADLILQAEVLSGRRLNAEGVPLPIPAAELQRLWLAYRDRSPEDCRLTKEDLLAWHRREAEVCLEGAWWSASTHLDRLLEAFPQEWPLYEKRGRAAQKIGLFDRAVKDYSVLLARKPDDGDLLTRRGACQARLKEHGKAVADFTRALELKPNDRDLLLRRGESYLGRKEWQAALADATTAIGDGKKKGWQVWHLRSLAHHELGHKVEAAADLTSALRAFAQVEEVCKEPWQWPVAVAYLDDLIKQREEKEFWLWRHYRGRFHARLGQWQAAADDFDRALDLYYPKSSLSEDDPRPLWLQWLEARAKAPTRPAVPGRPGRPSSSACFPQRRPG